MTLSTASRIAAYAQETGEVFLVLLRINHPSLAQPIRVVNNTENIISRGDEYIAYPFDLVLPDDTEEREVIARLTIDNVAQELTEIIRTIQTRAIVRVEVIRASDPDIVEISMLDFVLRNVTWNALTITGDLVLEDLSREPFPSGSFDPSRFPALF